MSKQVFDEAQIELLSTETDDNKKFSKQAIYSSYGALILMLTLTPAWDFIGIFGTAIAFAALVITPGLAFDGVLFGGIRRVSGSTAGIALVLSAAWYAGLIGLLFSFGVPFQADLIALITAFVSSMSVGYMMAVGKAYKKVEEGETRKMWLAISVVVAAVVSILAGSLTVAGTMKVTQPEGGLSLMYLKNTNYDLNNRYVASEEKNKLSVFVKTSTSEKYKITTIFTSESKYVSTVKTSTTVKSNNEMISVKVPKFSGCGFITITSGDLTIGNIPAKATSSTKCLATAQINLWDKLGIDLDGAPTDSLKSLLAWLSTQESKGTLESLPLPYRNCISLKDQSKILQCIDRLK